MFDLTARLSVLSSLAILVNGLAWPGPRPTAAGFGEPMAGISPRPTGIPELKARFAGHELFERADNPLSVCGYVSGIRSSSVTCPGGRSCFFNAPISAAGCCFYSTDSPVDCGQYTGCVASSAISQCTGSCSSDSFIIKCSSSTAPYCFTFAFPGYKNIGCGVVPGSQNVLFTYSGQTEQTSAGSSQVQTVTVFSSAATDKPTPTYGPLGGGTPTGSSTSNSKKSGANIGAIAGGAVGGLAILALFVLGLVWLLRRNKNKAATAATAAGAGGIQPKPYDQQQQQQYDTGVYDPQMSQPMSPAPQYNPVPGTFYDQAAAIPQKHEYSAVHQQPVQQPGVYNQYQQPQQYQQPPPPPVEIHEAPTTQH